MRYILVKYMDYDLPHIPDDDWNNIFTQLGGTTFHKVRLPQPFSTMLIDCQMTIRRIYDKYVIFIVETYGRNPRFYPAGLSNILYFFDNYYSVSAKQIANDAIKNQVVGAIALTLSGAYQSPLLGIYLSSRNNHSLGDLSNPQWWVQEERYRQRTLDMRNQVKWVSYYLDDLDNFLEKEAITEIVENNLVTEIEVAHLELPDATFQPWHLGVTDEASTGFVEDCVKSLVPKNITFTIWVDAGKHYRTWTSKDGEKRRSEDGMFYEEIFFKNTYDYLPNCNQVEKIPFHAYVEYHGKVYDSQFAYPNGVDLTEYQSKITSNWRQSINVSADMDVQAVLDQFQELVNQAKSTNLESLPLFK